MTEFVIRVTQPGLPDAQHRAEGTLRLGRGADCEVVLADPLVSRHHAEFSVEGDRLRVRDLGSRNGTRVGGELLQDGVWDGPLDVLIELGPYRIAVATALDPNATVVGGPLEAEAARPVDSSLQTIMFTDIVDSTKLQRRLGDEDYRELLQFHDDSVQTAIRNHGGRKIKHTGDGIMAAFTSATSAIQAAMVIQRVLASDPEGVSDADQASHADGADQSWGARSKPRVPLRIGLNAGEPIPEGEDLFGIAVTLASRIGDRAQPGEILISNVVRELVQGRSFAISPLPPTSLKGFDDGISLFSVAWDERDTAG